MEYIKNNKFIRILLLVVLFVATLLVVHFFTTLSAPSITPEWNGVVANSFDSGTGTVSNPYVISSASEFAYFKSLLEGSNANLYLNKNYLITNSFNYGNYDMSINNTSAFTGTIDGMGHVIENAKITTDLFNSLNGATIKNISFRYINYNLASGTGGIITTNSTNSSFEMILFEGNISITNTTGFGGFIYQDNNSTINKVVINNKFLTSTNTNNTYTFIYNANRTIINNVLLRSDRYNHIRTNNSTTTNLTYFTIVSDNVSLTTLSNMNDFKNADYEIIINKGKFLLKGISDVINDPTNDSITYQEHASGITNDTVYVNDLVADYNYYYGYNYASSSGTTIPTGENRNIYNSSNLVKVMISYSGIEEVGNTSLIGTFSSTEAQNKIVYYKYIPVVNNQITITLIDNPFTNRPSGMGFNNWVSDTEGVTLSFDRVVHERYATVSVTPKSGGGYEDVALSFHASWVRARIGYVTSSGFESAFNTFYSAGLHEIDLYDRIYNYSNIDMSVLYEQRSVSRNTRYTGYIVSGNGNNASITYVNNQKCNSTTCIYYVFTTDNSYNQSKTYYYNNNNRSFSVVNETYLLSHGLTYTETPIYNSNNNMAGYYASVNFSYGASYNGYLDTNGNVVNGTCNQSNCTYYKFLQSFDEYGNINYYDSDKTYYYYTTRDTNIAYLTGNVSGEWGNSYTKPFTFTGLVNGTLSNSVWDVSSGNITLYQDVTIENMIISSGKAFNTTDANTSSNSIINANYHNLKIGRGLRRSGTYTNFNGFIGGSSSTGTSGTNTRYRLIIESGFYSTASMSMYNTSSTNLNLYIEAKGIYGNDYDRVNNNNNNLLLHETAAALMGGKIYSNSEFGIELVVKSGSFGNGKNDMYAGIYAGGVNNGNLYVPTKIKVEGGYIYNLIGGPISDGSSRDKNLVYFYMTGGEVDLIIGGAGYSPSYGNRIISVTGGKVIHSIFGGSNGFGNQSGVNDGRLNGSSFIYVGGNAVIGDDNVINQGTSGYLFGAESGSVFGNGNGKASTGNTDYSGIGSNINAYIIIDGNVTVKNSVYGGGNYGTAGRSSNSGTSLTDIKIIGGTINQNVYGGGNRSGAGYTNITATTNITMTGGNVLGNIYGGANESGIVYGASNVSILDGNVSGNVYGGGKGNQTFIRTDSNVIIGSTTVNKPEITGNVYGGSAFGTVNSNTANGTSYGNTAVTVNNGVITGSVFGGGEGSTAYTPNVRGNINVTINGGDITNVFGGNDKAGSHTSTNEVYLRGGIVENAFGGGNQSSVTTTHVYLQGATVNTIYGGSNLLGAVTTSNVNLTSGTAATVFGGNNEGGSCATTNVTVNGASITSSIYGGGNEVNTTTSNVTLTSSPSTIPNVYGGGNEAGVTTTHINQNGTTVTNMFGGSNTSGSVNNSIITHNSGTTSNLYGGNNAGGSTITSTINYINGNSSYVYGGGNQANGDTSNITITNGTITNIFGGGNQAGLTTANVIVNNGTIDYVYGGSNNYGVVSYPHITVNNTLRRIYAIYGGGNLAQVQNTDIVFNSGQADNIYAGGNYAIVYGNTSLDINGGTINQNVYGGGNEAIVQGNSNVTITNATILGSAYAGGNGIPATLQGNTNITIDGNTTIGSNSSVSPTSGCVFGGGNQAVTGISTNNTSTSTVNIVGATIYGNVYGGANTSVVYGNTVVNIGRDAVNNNALTSGNIFIRGHVFGGGEANASGSEIYDWNFISVTVGTHINIDATSHTNFDINGSFYGGGNASSASGDSYLSIKNYGTRNNPKHNISIQRVTYATIDNSSMLLAGAIDRANEYDNELFSISRVVDLTLKNNSELYLETGANLLENYYSLNSNDTPATVTINEGVVTKSTDNRIYMYEGKNLNIAKDQQVTDYGSVTGMTFFGLFIPAGNNVNTGLYKPSYANGDTINWSDAIFTKGSYVLGKHETDHDITVNGFYSNFIDDETQLNEVRYIEPTPASARFYMWFIGENIIEYNVALTASKYSTLGSTEVSFYEFTEPNTSFQILGFDYSEIEPGVSLVNKNSIPRIANNPNDANNVFGLSLESSNSGWLTTGKTSFYTLANNNISGTTLYEGESTTTVPTMLFYLYHSKNISVAKDLGTVRITVMSITKINALSSEIKRLVINVNMSTALFQTVEYEGAMTPGDKYELFASTTNNITTKSKLSAYYSLYASNSNAYRTGYHRVLTSTYVLPENTKITMLEFINGQPNYYYYIITSADVANATAEYQLYNECSYSLSLFTRMGSKSNSDHYNDASANLIYYDGTDSNEEFIFIVDFIDTNIQSNQLNNTLLMEMRDANDDTVIHFLGIERNQLTYNLYTGYDSVIDINVDESANPLYVGYTDIFDISVSYQSSVLGGANVIDTQYFDSKLGVLITVLDNNNQVVNGTSLMGSYFEMDGIRYYPNIDGTTRIKLSEKVGNAEKWIIFHTENSSIITGNYTFSFEAFPSPDGIYYTRGQVDTDDVNITIINSSYGLNPVIDEDSVIFSSTNDKNLKFSVAYQSLLTTPSIRLALYRRKYDTTYDTNYELVDLQDYVTEALFPTSNPNEYLLKSNPSANNRFDIELNSELLTGTYRLAFRLYDSDTQIGEVIRYIIIK